MTKAAATEHAEWLSLMEVSGPFLSVPVLARAMPQGLEADEPDHVRSLKIALAELEEDETLAPRWVRWVLEHTLGYPAERLVDANALPATLTHRVAEHGITLRPELAVLDGEQARLLVDIWPHDQPLDGRIADDVWAASPRERTAELLRATGVRLGLATNGYIWTLVSAKQGESTGFATWDAELWLEERLTLRAFRTIVGVERTLGAPDGEALEDLLDRSADAQQEVTDQLGKQVRFAIELLVGSLDRADQDRGGELLGKVPNEQLYLAAVTVMMRLVFLFTAEERGLLPLSDPLYADSYAASPLRAALQEEADRHSEEPLERRSSAWHRLLAGFRAVHGGIRHDQLRLPPYGGELFDPERFPFLEGRDREVANAGQTVAEPLPIDDRTVLHILDALQLLHTPGGSGSAQRLSYRSLDVEQIGHVYEGLLDHTAVRATAPAIGLAGKLEPEIGLAEIERRAEDGGEALAEWLAKETGRGAKAIANRLDNEPDADHRARLLAACGGDESLCERVAPYHELLRTDLRGYPTVFLAGSVYVTRAGERRSSGTYYTTRDLAEEVVKHALDPLVHAPGPAEEADPAKWMLKPPAELLELKVCDMAMGSGAFLVASCRYLADRLVEAWAKLGEGAVTVMGRTDAATNADPLVPADAEERAILARRMVADRCLYGVDKNPMAVDMAKLSLWLVTMAKDRPFNFLDHALLTGDALLGVTDMRQVEHFHIDPKRGAELHGTLFDYTKACGDAVDEAIAKRRALEEFTALDIRDSERKERLHHEAAESLDTARLIADLVIGSALATAEQGDSALETALVSVEDKLRRALDEATPEEEAAFLISQLRDQTERWLDAGRPPGTMARNCFHWPLELAEVFAEGRHGFDAVVGNPPFMSGNRISQEIGHDINAHVAKLFPPFSKRVDISARFLARSAALIHPSGYLGQLATNTISQGTTRKGGLDILTGDGLQIVRARKDFDWPGVASVIASAIWLTAGQWRGERLLDGSPVPTINSLLESSRPGLSKPRGLAARRMDCFQGSGPWGDGFSLSAQVADEMLRADSRNGDVVRTAVGGKELNAQLRPEPDRWVINMEERSLDAASAYLEPFAHLSATVRPWREVLDPKRYPRIVGEWWKYFHPRQELYDEIEARQLDRLMARCRVSDHHMVAWIPADCVYLDSLSVWCFDDWSWFGVIQSGVHEAWARQYASTLKRDMRYGATNCFRTFPAPESSETVGRIAERYEAARFALGSARGVGLTGVFNLVHDMSEAGAESIELRRLQAELDYAVRDAYGWDDLELGHDFHETRQGMRHTIEPVGRIEVLDRLLELNHARYDEEVKAGFQGQKAKPVGGRVPRHASTAQETLL